VRHKLLYTSPKRHACSVHTVPGGCCAEVYLIETQDLSGKWDLVLKDCRVDNKGVTKLVNKTTKQRALKRFAKYLEENV